MRNGNLRLGGQLPNASSSAVATSDITFNSSPLNMSLPPSPLPQIADEHRRAIVRVYLGLRILFLAVSVAILLVAPEQLSPGLPTDARQRLWLAWFLFAGWTGPLVFLGRRLLGSRLALADRLISLSLIPDAIAIFLAASVTGGPAGFAYRSVYFLIAIHSYHFSPNPWAAQPWTSRGGLLPLGLGAVITVAVGMTVFCWLAGPSTPFARYALEGGLQAIIATVFLLVRWSDLRGAQRLATSHENLWDIQEELHRERETKRDFLRQLAHELATPLAALRNQIDFLEDVMRGGRHVRDSEEQFAYLREQAEFIQYLVSDIQYQFERGAAIRARYDFSRAVDLRRTIERINKLLLPTARMDKQIDIVTGTTRMPSLYVDRRRMEQVIFNLVQNAVKYSRPGSGDIFIGYDLVEESDGSGKPPRRWHRLRFEDWGVGVKESDLPFIFEEYRRGTNIEGAPSGTGLGLAVATQIVEAHGGRLSVVNLKNPTEFAVDLPEKLGRRPPGDANPADR